MRRALSALSAALIVGVGWTQPAHADIFFDRDGVIRGALCVGEDCLTHESFAEATLRLKANVLRLRFDDTSEASNFPSADWELAANDPLGGGANYFALRETGVGTTPLRISAGAGHDALVLGAGGAVGLGTALPETALHVRGGDTPTIRLEQDTSQAFAPQSWDLGGNEAGFFLRDAVAGTLPMRVRPGAPAHALVVAGDGDVGLGLLSPEAALHIRANQANNAPHLKIETRRTGGRAEIWFADRDTDDDGDALRLQLAGDTFNISFSGTGGAELQITKAGDVRMFRGDLVVANGGVIVGGQTLNVPDYVFAPDYPLMPLGDVAAFIAAHSHLPHVPSEAEVRAGGLDMVAMQLALLRTVEEQMLHILALEARLGALEEGD